MIENIGIDIVENSRFENLIEDTAFINRILANSEKEYFMQITNQKRKVEFLASRFAAKEAFSKAFTSTDSKINFKDIEVLKEASGRPYIKFSKDDKIKSFLSISHSDNYSVAQVIIAK